METAYASILESAQAERAWDTVLALAEDLQAPRWRDRMGPDLARGWAGAAFFYAALDRARPGDGWDQEARTLLHLAMEHLESHPLTPGFFGGYTGIAWAVEMLQHRLWSTGEDLIGAVDEALLAHLEQGDDLPLDLASGVAGWLVYGVARRHRPSGALLVERAVRQLAASAAVTPEGWTWGMGAGPSTSLHDEGQPSGGGDFGMAHGVGGVIAALTATRGVTEGRAERLAEMGLRWLRAERLRTDRGGLLPEDQGGPSALSWCSGELGLSAVGMGIADHLGDAAWASEAAEMGRSCAIRCLRGEEPMALGLCHGIAGGGLLFLRMHARSGDERLLDAAQTCFRRLLARRGKGSGPAGFETWGADAPDAHALGVLGGGAGLGLSLLEALGIGTGAWRRLLLLP